MARLSDIAKIRRSIGLYAFARRVIDESSQDNLPVWASAMAYSWLFAIFPFAIFLLALVPYMPKNVQDLVSQNQARAVLAVTMPDIASKTVMPQIDQNSLVKSSGFHGPLLYLGLFLALWGASSGTSMTMSALDRCYELDKGRSLYWHRLVAIMLTILIAVMLIGVMCLLPIATAIKALAMEQGIYPGSRIWLVFDFGRWVLSLVLMVLVLTLIYYKGPAIRQHYTLITPGAAFVIIVWVVLGLLFRLYVDLIGSRGFGQTYGAVGGVALLLLFFYLDALVLMIGAEINAEIDFAVLGIRRGTNDFRNCVDLTNGPPSAC